MSVWNISKVDQIEYIATQAIDSVRLERKKYTFNVDTQLLDLISTPVRVFPIHLPPLASRQCDVTQNVRHIGTSVGMCARLAICSMHKTWNFYSELFRIAIIKPGSPKYCEISRVSLNANRRSVHRNQFPHHESITWRRHENYLITPVAVSLLVWTKRTPDHWTWHKLCAYRRCFLQFDFWPIASNRHYLDTLLYHYTATLPFNNKQQGAPR